MAYKSFEDILNDVYDSTNKALKIKVTALDDQPINLGTGSTVKLLYETADANANYLAVIFPEGGAVDVPAFVIGDASIDNVDTAVLNGLTEPSYVVFNDAADAYASLDAGDDAVAGSKGLYFKPAADEDVELLNMSLTGTPRIYWDESEDKFHSTKDWYIDGITRYKFLSAGAGWTDGSGLVDDGGVPSAEFADATAAKYTTMGFAINELEGGFVSFTSAKLLMSYSGTNNSAGNLYFSIQSRAAASGEVNTTHSESPALAAVNVGVNNSVRKLLTPTNVITLVNVAAGDYVGIVVAITTNHADNTIDRTIQVQGVLIEYVARR